MRLGDRSVSVQIVVAQLGVHVERPGPDAWPSIEGHCRAAPPAVQ
jgi:hypothetical protein